MANYPTSQPSATPADHAEVLGELRAVAAELGTLPKGGATDVKTRSERVARQVATGGGLYIAGRYYDGSYNGANAASATISISANSMRLAPFYCHTTTTFDRIGIAVTTSGAGNARLGIYNANTSGLPGTVLLDAGTVSVGSVAGVELTISQSLTADTLYWLAVVSDVSFTMRARDKSASISVGITSLTQDNNSDQPFSSFTYAALSSTPTISYGNVYPPRIMLRAS